MTTEELQKLDDEKKAYQYKREEIYRVLGILKEVKDVDYVEELLVDEFTILGNKVEELHNRMFPKP